MSYNKRYCGVSELVECVGRLHECYDRRPYVTLSVWCIAIINEFQFIHSQ